MLLTIGMSSTDLRLAFERHTTSKIKKAEDLFSPKPKDLEERLWLLLRQY